MFLLEGEGGGPLNGALIASSRNRVNAYMTGDSFGARSLWGKVDSTQQRMTLEGVDASGAKIKITATRQ